MAKRKWTPEQWAAWSAKKDAVIAAGAGDRRRLSESIERYEHWIEERRIRDERRRQLIGRLTFGLLTRG